jgi:hypothetical protein
MGKQHFSKKNYAHSLYIMISNPNGFNVDGPIFKIERS